MDLLVRSVLGRDDPSPVPGSDSPSRPGELASCKSEDVPLCKERSSPVSGISGALGKLRMGGPASAASSIWGRCVTSDLFELELPLAIVPRFELTGETGRVSIKAVVIG